MANLLHHVFKARQNDSHHVVACRATDIAQKCITMNDSKGEQFSIDLPILVRLIMHIVNILMLAFSSFKFECMLHNCRTEIIIHWNLVITRMLESMKKTRSNEIRKSAD